MPRSPSLTELSTISFMELLRIMPAGINPDPSPKTIREAIKSLFDIEIPLFGVLYFKV
jgi:hypothetical protein